MEQIVSNELQTTIVTINCKQQPITMNYKKQLLTISKITHSQKTLQHSQQTEQQMTSRRTMHTASSAQRTCFAFASASEYTATVLMPSFLQVLMIRHAISPLFATKILSNNCRQ